MKKTLFATFLLCSSSLTTPAFSVLEADGICNLSDAFVTKGKLHLSPVEGVDSSVMQGFRFNGHYGTKTEGQDFPQAPHNQLSDDDFPQDYVAALIQRLFPSPVLFELSANNLTHDSLRKWLTPETTARLFNVIDNHDDYKALSEDSRLLELMKALLPTVVKQREAYYKKTHHKAPNEALNADILPREDLKSFASLLDNAILTSRDPHHSNGQFYLPHIVERALLTYMCMQAKGKLDLKGYYDNLSAESIRDVTVSPNLASVTTEEDYFRIKEELASGVLSLDEFLMSPEKMLQLHFGFSLYEDQLPPFMDYSTVSYKDPDGKVFKFSNCGEATLLGFLNAVLFDANARQFDLTPLKRSPLSAQNLLKFYQETQPTPSKVQNNKTENAFVQLMSNLNTAETQDPIQYRKSKGKVQKKGENGIYEMAAGLDNFLRVIGSLLGDPEWKIMEGSDILQAVADNLNRFCAFFTREGFEISWHTKRGEDQEIKDQKSCDLTFLFNGEKKFDLTFGQSHFGFERSNLEIQEEIYELGDRLLSAEKPWHPYFSFFIKDFDSILNNKVMSPEKREAYMKGYLYSSDLSSLEKRGKALMALGKYKKEFQSEVFDDLISRWLQPDGKYFDYWQDTFTSEQVLDVVALWMPLEDIRALNIEAFSTFLAPINRVKNFKRAYREDYPNIARHILLQEGALEALSKQSFTENYDDLAEELEEGQTYVPLVFSLLHALSSLDLDEFIDEAISLGGDVHAFTPAGESTLHLAARKNAIKSLQKLLSLGVDVNLLDESFPYTPLTHAIEERNFEAMELLMNAGGLLNRSPNVDRNGPTTPKDNIKILEFIERYINKSGDLANCLKIIISKSTEQYFKNFIKDLSSESKKDLMEEILDFTVQTGDLEKLSFLQREGVM